MIFRRCAGRYRHTDRPRCNGRARRWSRYCTLHGDQRPDDPAHWLVEGRTRRAPEVMLHLVVVGDGNPDVIPCSGRLAGDLDESAPPSARTCARCRRLALKAVAAGEVEPDHLRRWNLGEPNVDERAAQS